MTRTPRRTTNERSSPRQPQPPQQIVEGTVIGRKLTQSSDQERTQQRVAFSSANDLAQKINAKKDELSAFGVRGKGLVAVVIAGVIVLALLLLKYLY
jgi:hypothetical protein